MGNSENHINFNRIKMFEEQLSLEGRGEVGKRYIVES